MPARFGFSLLSGIREDVAGRIEFAHAARPFADVADRAPRAARSARPAGARVNALRPSPAATVARPFGWRPLQSPAEIYCAVSNATTPCRRALKHRRATRSWRLIARWASRSAGTRWRCGAVAWRAIAFSRRDNVRLDSHPISLVTSHETVRY